MTTRQTQFLSELVSDEPISEGTLAYLGARAKDRFYDYVLRKFLEREKSGFTRADLARKIGKRPEVITRCLGAPGNWTIETVSELLAGICAEELEPHSVSFEKRASRNFTDDEWLHEPIHTSSASNTVIVTFDGAYKPSQQHAVPTGKVVDWKIKHG